MLGLLISQRIFMRGSALISSLRISAFLCASAVTGFTDIFTAETQRNAETRREDFKLLLRSQSSGLRR